MRRVRAKAIRKFVSAAYPIELQNEKYAELKKAKRKANQTRALPKDPKPFSSKIHKGESFQDFQKRRKAVNKRSRVREKG